MGKRRAGREHAVQVLYGIELSGKDPETAIAGHQGNFDVEPEAAGFARDLIHGVIAHRDDLDAVIAEASEHWRLARMSAVDRNIMRVAVFEMLYTAGVPPSVAIDEAIEVAKTYGSESSPPFINGVLDRASAIIAAGRGKKSGKKEP
ncbi:MAG: transcription antitermination factor NusB [Myxococcota bacterium]